MVINEFCLLCCRNDAFELFDDINYTLPPVYSDLYNLYLETGYNHVINHNSINRCFVCNYCLINVIYDCDTEKKYYMLQQLRQYFAIQKVSEEGKLPVELFNYIRTYL